MNFQQLRSIREAIRHSFNLTEAANAMFTSQPGVSRQIRELEEELGVQIFERQGKRLTGLTDPGRGIVPLVERLLLDAENLKRASADFIAQQTGRLTVATTHTQGRYVLPPVVKQFKQRYPNVKLVLQQSSPQDIVALLRSGEADIGIATEALEGLEELLNFPCYQWHHVVLVPKGHPLTQQPLSAQSLAQYPLITYDSGLSGRSRIDEAFTQLQIKPDIVLSAMDADVIKTYVEAELGVGIIAEMAFDQKKDTDLEAIDAGHIFATNTTRLAIRRGAYLRNYAYQFIECFSPSLTRRFIEQARRQEQSSHYDI
ncbi:CysB family HTH-type transcriptional regulator [Ampullimonas aquatilis]|uniref:CysB family HTH-type transcriptional regulator n=1 Tax=Ampullimonas aquatilis TaxID=1341549 RepID=UPI003C70D074